VVEIADDLREHLLGLLVQVADGNTRSEDGIVGVRDGHVRSRLCGQVVELDGSDTLVHSRDDFLGNRGGIDMFAIKTVTETRNSGSDLVELNALLASVYERVLANA
jgi:hypothetical protein